VVTGIRRVGGVLRPGSTRPVSGHLLQVTQAP
jgi:hypothetical protein